jgi:nucleoside-diphosphate-sugar epimerase
MKEVQAGGLSATIARAADFYGPDTQNGVPNVLVFAPFAKGAKAAWLVNAEVPHSLTFTPDAARGVAMLADQESAWNQVWHLPTSPNPPTGRQFIAMAAGEFRVAPKYRVWGRPMLRVARWFNSQVRESYEMLYQSDSPYLFDSTKFANQFGFARTSYRDGVRIAADSYKRNDVTEPRA